MEPDGANRRHLVAHLRLDNARRPAGRQLYHITAAGYLIEQAAPGDRKQR